MFSEPIKGRRFPVQLPYLSPGGGTGESTACSFLMGSGFVEEKSIKEIGERFGFTVKRPQLGTLHPVKLLWTHEALHPSDEELVNFDILQQAVALPDFSGFTPYSPALMGVLNEAGERAQETYAASMRRNIHLLCIRWVQTFLCEFLYGNENEDRLELDEKKAIIPMVKITSSKPEQELCKLWQNIFLLKHILCPTSFQSELLETFLHLYDDQTGLFFPNVAACFFVETLVNNNKLKRLWTEQEFQATPDMEKLRYKNSVMGSFITVLVDDIWPVFERLIDLLQPVQIMPSTKFERAKLTNHYLTSQTRDFSAIDRIKLIFPSK